MSKRRLTWRPDLPDHRDLIYGAINTSAPLPIKVDLRPLCSPVDDQGNIGSCTGHAIVGAMEYLENKQSESFADFSRLFVYYNERLMEGTVEHDAGARIRDGIKVVANTGCCIEGLWPYEVSKYKDKPTQDAYDNAANHKILEYRRVTSFDDLKAALAEDNPVVFGFTVYESFMSQAVAKTGLMPMPGRNERSEGGHAVCAVGYDDETKTVTVRNSWGPNWGDHGYFHMPYAYISNYNLCDDFWVIKKEM